MSLPTVTLAPTDVETTRLGFGCAGLLRDPSAKGRQAVLHAALDAGVRHFDVARMYGLGKAEAELGTFAQGRRDELVIATKFGIDPSGAVQKLAALQAPARKLLAKYPQLKKLVKRREEGLYEPRRYDGAGARASLETSLRELRTDHVDLLFLHGPGPLDDVRTEDVCAELERMKDEGKLRAWGVSGAPDPTLALVPQLRAPVVTQLYDDPWVNATAHVPDTSAPITFGVIAGTLDTILGHLSSDPDAARRWSEAVGADCTDPRTVAALALRAALAANPRGAVLFSTTKPANVQAAAATAARSGDEEQVAAFVALATAEVAAPEGET